MHDIVSRTKVRSAEAGPAAASWDIARPAQSVYQLLAGAWSKDPGRIAATVIPTGNPGDGDIRISRGELLERVNRAANLFSALGVGPNDSVATLLVSGIDALTVIYGAQAAGIAAPLNPMLRISELEHLIALSGARILVVNSDPALGIWEKAEALAQRVPGLRLFSIGPTVPGIDDFHAACAAFDGQALQFSRRIMPTHVAAYIHTGGTTGLPKLARITHDNFIYGAWAQSRGWGFGENDVILSALPLFHVSGLATLATVPLSVGAEVVFLSPSGFRNPEIVANFWRIVEKYRGSFSAFVPTIATTLAGVPVDGADFSTLRTIMIGGAAASVETLRRLKAQVPAQVVVTFGQTECLVGTGTSPGQELDPMSSGPASPYMQIRIGGADGTGLPAGIAGDILLKGPAVFAGYNGQPDGEGFTSDGWLMTGDVGWLDEDGSLFVTGRTKDLIIRSGHNIDPRAIEEAGASHPSVASCAAVGAPDRYAGEIPVLYVSLVEGADTSPEELIAWVAERVPERPATPRHVHILPVLPVTAVGKVFKPSLRLDAATRVAHRELAELLAEAAIINATARQDDKCGIVIDLVTGQDWPVETVQARAEALLAGLLLGFNVLPHTG